jgi:MoaA/NifB/PqqE/SkfB family radical SAM enzyme
MEKINCMNWLDKFNSIKVEITSHCNAKCPGCTRNITGGKNVSDLKLDHMPYELWHRVMHEDTKGMEIVEVLFDGNVGDFCMNPKAIDFIKTAHEAHPDMFIQINTNGGARTEQWWAEFGEVIAEIPHRVNFAIDGLEDTHHIHRRSTTYEIVVRNMKAFVSKGGNANWIFTYFDHNLHQVDEARKRAIDYGCYWFQTRWSCIPGEDLYVKTDTEEYEIGTENIYEMEEYMDHIRPLKHMQPEFEEGEHMCPAYTQGQITIDFRGILWPCSYIYSTEVRTQEFASPFRIEMQHPGETISLHKHALPDILSNTFFKDQLPDAITNKKLSICNMWCFND